MSLVVLAAMLAVSQGQQPYLDPALPVNRRAADLIGRLTLAEKVAQMQHEAPAIPRLGIPAYTWWSEALHGAVGNPVTVYPQAIGLSAGFDTDLLGQVASAISDEGRARYEISLKRKGATGMHEGLDFWAPNINIFRDPRWGRGQETYGEDPFLTSRMAVAYIKGLQGERGGRFKAIATPKHYAVHSGPDPDRHHFNAIADTRDMWNTYLPAFRASITEAGAWSIMSAYSAVNGEPASASPTLLQRILRDDWGFQGYVVSDCGAISDIVYGHKAAKTEAEGGALAVNAGCDLECGGAYHALVEAVNKHLISEATIDKSLTRLFEARIRMGMFDPVERNPWRGIPASTIDSPAHRALALKAARSSMVLLKNDGTLPLRGAKTIAVIGPNADDKGVPLGNYNGTPSHTTTVLEGIQNLAPKGTNVLYARGSGRLSNEGETSIPSECFPAGVDGVFYRGQELKGTPIKQVHAKSLDFDWGNDAPAPGMPKDNFSARWTAAFVAPANGTYSLGTRADDGTRVWLDGKLIVDDWNTHPAGNHTAQVELEGGKLYQLRVEYFEGSGQASIRLVWAPPTRKTYDEPVQLAKRSDVVVLVLGISGEVENEEHDRTTIELPEPQKGLLQAVLATGKPVVVVLESGSCLAVDDPRINGLLQAWYPGENGGVAVAETLFGKNNPGGRLPVTFYKSLDQVPAFTSYKMDGRTYRYMKAKPLYPFGYGLSYTRFRYGKAAIAIGKANGAFASVQVKNVGTVDGDEVVQVYASRNGARWPEPLRKLVGFTRIHLKAGEARVVRIALRDDALAQADGTGKMTILRGNYDFSLGGGQPGMEPSTSGPVAKVRVALTSRTIPSPVQRKLPQVLQ